MNTILESLPNELNLDIFDYVKIRDLSNGFWGLNCRINQLIRLLTRLSVVITRKDLPEINFFTYQIVRMVIVASETIDLSQFSNLRSLSLEWTTIDQLKEIQPNILPNLVYLSILSSLDGSSKRHLILDIFSNQYPALRSVDLGSIEIFQSNLFTQSHSLRSVYVRCGDLNIVSFILNYCPLLYRLQVYFTEDNSTINTSSFTLSNHPLKQLFLLEDRHTLFVNDITPLLFYLPNLEWIKFHFGYCSSFIHLIENLVDQLFYLRRFDCFIVELLTNKNEIIDINIIQKMHRSFRSIQSCIREDGLRLFDNSKTKIKKENSPIFMF